MDKVFGNKNNEHSDEPTLQSAIEVREKITRKSCTIHEEIEPNVDEDKLGNLLESS